jgi:hypothetical protein
VFERVEGGRIRLIADDGRNHVLRTDKSYDVILSDSTHPRTADSWVLYTRDFYNLCRRRLEDDGVMAQWVPLHGLTEDDYKMIVRTFRSVFPHATVWLNPRYSVLLGTPGPLRVDLERLGERLRSPRARAGLQEVNLSDPLSLLATLALDEAAAKEYAGSGRINTDDRAAIGFGDRRRSRTTGGLAVLIGLLPRLTVRAGEVVRAPPRALERVERRLRSRQRVLAGVVALRLGDRTRAATEMERAVALDPGNPEAVRQLRRIAGP